MNEILLNEHATHGIWIEADVCEPESIQTACIAALDTFTTLRTRYPEERLGMTLAFGANVWHSLKHAHEAAELKNFPSYGTGDVIAPATQHDLLIHLQGQSQDSVITLATDVLHAFNTALIVQQETHGFRRHENRGFDGFVDGTENPHEAEKILATAQDKHGGSYIVFQRYQHNLRHWQTYDVPTQEEAVARSKATDEEFNKTVRHTRSHLARTNLKENGVGLKIVRRSLPYGSASGEKGLAFIAYAARLHNIEAQLQHMFGEADGLTDLLLERLSQAVSGGYYYAPSQARLRDL